MPRKRVMDKRRPHSLTFDEWLELATCRWAGQYDEQRRAYAEEWGEVAAGRLFPFASEEERRTAWGTHRREFLEEWDYSGRRPGALWDYDMPPGSWCEGETEEEALRRLGLLRPEEEALLAKWRAL